MKQHNGKRRDPAQQIERREAFVRRRLFTLVACSSQMVPPFDDRVAFLALKPAVAIAIPMTAPFLIHGETGEWEVVVGLHLIGNELEEQTVLNAGLAIEERAGFTARPEKWW
jgi:hypothetical protein